MTSYSDIRAQVIAGELPLFDLRSPSEFAKGSIPRAHSLPIFSDEERAQIGTLYKRSGPQEAVAVGLEFFAESASAFFEEFDALRGPAAQVALYCWRGGMRSSFVAMMCRLRGIEVVRIEGGYKAYRQEVLADLEALASHRLMVLQGRTGCGKTDVIRDLYDKMPVIDFEGLARHRGSAFGAVDDGTPVTQQNFENNLSERYTELRDAPQILVEIERAIGPVHVPTPIWRNIIASPMVLLERSFDDRVERLTKEYGEFWFSKREDEFRDRLGMLRRHLPNGEFERMMTCFRRGDARSWVSAMLQLRYDKAYDKSIERYRERVVAEFNLTRDTAGIVKYLQSQLGEEAL